MEIDELYPHFIMSDIMNIIGGLCVRDQPLLQRVSLVPKFISNTEMHPHVDVAFCGLCMRIGN